MNVNDVLRKYMKDNGYDGLYEGGEGCGCSLDDFMPCGTCNGECEFGVKREATQEEKAVLEIEFMIVPKSKEGKE